VEIRKHNFFYAKGFLYKEIFVLRSLYEVRLPSSWTQLITPSRNFVEVR
jgi:hypothetical protein